MNITSNNTMIFKKEFEGKVHYRAGLSTKKQDGTYDKGYIDIRLPKGVELENQTKIDITKGFLSFYNYKGKDDKQHTIWYIVVQEYSKKDDEKKQENTKDHYQEFGDKIATEDDDLLLPF